MTTPHNDDEVRTSFWHRVPYVVSLASIGWLAALTIVFSDTGVAWPLWTAFFVTGIALTGWWLLQFVIVAVADRSRKTHRLREAARFWVAVPLCIVLGVGISISNIPLIVRLYFSADRLLASAPKLAATPDVELFEHGQRVGLFRVREFTQIDRELRFKTSVCGLVDACGLVYSPGGPPPNRGEDTFRHLYGPWWHWYQSW